MSWTFGRKLALGFALAVLTIGLIGISGYRSTANLIEDTRWVNHTHEVTGALDGFVNGLIDAENQQRAYLLTSDESLIDVYRTRVAEAQQYLATVKRLTADNPRQQERLATLAPIMEARLAIAAKVLELRRSQTLDKVVESGLIREGKREMDRLRQLVVEADREEIQLLAERQTRSKTAADDTQTTILWGSLLGGAAVLIAGFLIARSLSSQIGVAVRHIQTSAAELQAAANQQATGAKQQASAMNEVTTTMSELLATSRQIAESAARVTDIAGQTSTHARTGDGTVSRGTDAVGAIKRQVDAIVSHMLELGKKSQQIGSVLDIVSELAEQTNILAINATIEAAGAGESGRRFGVVADEIRKLADRVGGSTKEIRGLIDDVRAAVNTTVMTTETGSKAVEAGAAQFGEVASTFRQIAGAVATTTEAAKEIGLSTKQQASAVEQVNMAVTNVAQATKESEVSTAQTLRTASELAMLSRDLLRLVEADRAPSIARAPTH